MDEGVFSSWSRAELIAALVRASTDRPAAPAPAPAPPAPQEGGGKKKRKAREMDFDKYTEVKIALKLAYFGWPYRGLAVQDDGDDTVEGQLFRALVTAKLIRDRQSCDFTRCGRTDKGVSSFGQVVSLNVRTNELKNSKEGGDDNQAQDGLDDADEEMDMDQQPQASSKRHNHSASPSSSASSSSNNANSKSNSKGKSPAIAKKPDPLNYVTILNRLLPENIRILSCVPVDRAFHARFSCLSRTYHYYFWPQNKDVEVFFFSLLFFLDSFFIIRKCGRRLNTTSACTTFATFARSICRKRSLISCDGSFTLTLSP